MSKKIVYLDHSAATPVDPEVLASMSPYFSKYFYNPSATYLPAQKVKSAVDEARQLVASIIGSKSQEIVFSAGATEANNLAIKGIMDRYKNAKVLLSAIEHESVLEPAKLYNHELIKVGVDGIINLNHLESCIDKDTVLISVMLANNEIGSVQPIKDIAWIIKDKLKTRTNKLPLYLHTDAAQAPNYLDIHVARLGVDLMSLNGGKLYGPKQSGCLYIKRGLVLSPQILGGGQEHGLRSGTENVPAIIGFAKSLKLAQDLRHQETTRLSLLQDDFIKQIKQFIPTADINGSLTKRLPNNLHLSFPGQDNERLLIELEEAGILAAAGSACSASSDQPSHVLKAIGLTDIDSRSSIRFSMGRSTTKEDIKYVVSNLRKIINK